MVAATKDYGRNNVKKIMKKYQIGASLKGLTLKMLILRIKNVVLASRNGVFNEIKVSGSKKSKVFDQNLFKLQFILILYSSWRRILFLK